MSTDTKARPDQARSRAVRSAQTPLESARRELAAGKCSTTAASRYIAAYLAALRVAATVVAVGRDPGITRRRKRPRSVWELLPKVEPALSGWAAYFATAGERNAVVTRQPRAVSLQEANELLRNAEIFVSLAENTLGGRA